jgi:hypothetical protein
VTPDELIRAGTNILEKAAARGVELRLIGGVAIRTRCPSTEAHPKLQRPYRDLDFVVAPAAWTGLPALFASLGFETRKATPTRASFHREGLAVDVRGTDFRDCFVFDLATRLNIARTTLPLADLLLLKLQRVEFAEKDIQDSTALLLDHRVADTEEDDAIDRVYLHTLTNKNWGLWTTVFDNTVTLEKVLDKYIDPEEAQLVWRRIELIQEVMDGKSKSFGWWMRSIPNRRLKWYRKAEDCISG